MVRQVASAVMAFVLALAVGTATWADCVGEQNAQAEMKCCAMMHHRCGKANAADCCHKMKGASPSSNVATITIAKVKVAAVFVALGVLPTDAVAPRPTDGSSMDVTVIRPHDPPHL